MQSSAPVSFVDKVYILVPPLSWHNHIHVEHVDIPFHLPASCRLIASSQTMQLGIVTSVVSIGAHGSELKLQQLLTPVPAIFVSIGSLLWGYDSGWSSLLLMPSSSLGP